MSSEAPRQAEGSASVVAEVTLAIGFILTGTVTTLIGPLLPVLSSQWALSDSRAGQFFISQFLSSTLGALCSDALARRFGSKRTLVFGFVLLTVGVWRLS